MWRGIPIEQPPELQGLTFMEEILIARSRLVVYVVRIKGYGTSGGVRAIKGNCMAVMSSMQTVTEIVAEEPLPRLAFSEDEKITVFVQNDTLIHGFKPLYVRRETVLRLLIFAPKQ